jgi:hypothetical protein
MYEPSNPMLVDLHNFLVRAAETESRLPSFNKRSYKTFWPEVTGERHVDYRPEKTRITWCGATGKQIDDFTRALEIVSHGLDNWMDRRIVWGVAHSAAFRDRGPRWTVLAQIFKRQMKSRPPEDGQKWPRYEKVIKSRYEEALLDIFCHLQGTN